MAAGGEIIISIAPDGGQATLSAPAGLKSVTPDAIRAVVGEAGVALNQVVDQNITDFAAEYGAGDSERTGVIARATPPVHGRDGRVEWCDEFNPEDQAAGTASDEKVTADSTESVNYYAGRNYVRVKTGDVIGVAYPPTEGTEGCDVRGRVINCRVGAPVSLKFQRNVSVGKDGRIIAQADGVLVLGKSGLSITALLDVAGDVDFSISNIDFNGSVNIAGGVLPGFEVKAKEDLHVNKLIEGAKIECGGNLIARSGMVGQDRGEIKVGGNAMIPYLDDVKGVVNGDLIVDREINDCRLIVGADLKCPNGAILGGEVGVTGSLVVKVLGSQGWTPTTIVLGEVPVLRGSRREAARNVAKFKKEIASLADQESAIKLNPRPSHEQREQLTEFSFLVSEIEQQLKACTVELKEIDAAMQSRCKLDVNIAQTIYPKVTLRIGDATVVFTDPVSGPLRIYWDGQKQLVYRIGTGDARPLNQIARVAERAGARPSDGPVSTAAA